MLAIKWQLAFMHTLTLFFFSHFNLLFPNLSLPMVAFPNTIIADIFASGYTF